jgi:NADH:ubiquinone oxidoreductase subunit E
MAGSPPGRIEICMGSSCFSRGNNRNIEVVQGCLARLGSEAHVELAGHLCQGHCKLGPNLSIDGKSYHAVDPFVVARLLSADPWKQGS